MRFPTTIGLIFVLSAVGLTYEIAAGRVLAPFYGTSLLTWTAVIATVLAGFSVGNAWGGFLAERPAAIAARDTARILALTAVLMAVSPMVLSLVYGIGARGTLGMFMGVILAFFPASVLVSAPSPYLAKLAVEARPGREGSSLGLVLAAGSAGAILGAILAGFVALPFAGSAATFAGCGAAALLCVAFLPGGLRGSLGTLLPAALLVGASVTTGPVCRFESGLSCIDTARSGATISLYSDRTRQAAERIDPAGATALELDYTRWLWDRLDRDLGASPRVLFIGGGGYSLPDTLLRDRPEARAIAVEIDPLVTQVVRETMPRAARTLAREGFDAWPETPATMAEDGRLGIVHADGRVFLNETARRFDAAVMDAFSSGSVPAHLATRETYERLAEIVDGPVYVNLIGPPDGPLARGLHAILSEIYPHVAAVRGPLGGTGRTNVLLAASERPLPPLDTLPDGYAPLDIAPGRVFTDNRGWIGHR